MKKERLFKIIKFILFIGMLVGSYVLSDKIVNYVSTLELELIKRVLNIVIVVIIVGIYIGNNK